MKIFIFILLLAGSVLADHNPIGLKKWHNGGNSYSAAIGGAVRNFERPDKSWKKINNNFVTEGDSVLKIDDAVIKCRTNKNGTSSSTLKWDGQDYVITQQLKGIGWLKLSTRGRQWIDNTMDFSNVSVDSSIVKWTGISPAVDYRVKKLNGQVQHGIFFKPAFLDSAVVLYNQRADSLDIALANVMVYTLSGNIDNHDSALGLLSKRQLKSFGKYTFNLKDQRLNYPGSDTLFTIPVGQFWKKRNDTIFCIEYVMMSQVKRVHELYPDSVIWHNATTKIGTTDVEDSDFRNAFAGDSFGGRDELRIKGVSSNRSKVVMRFKNLQSNIGANATIISAEDSMHQDNGRASTQDIMLYRLYKTSWIEGIHELADCTDGMTWEDWDCDDNEWTTVGCECAGDDGSDNTQDAGACDASGRDRKSTPESTTSVDATVGWKGFPVSSALVQAKYDADESLEVVLITTTASPDDAEFNSSENGSGFDPFLFVTFTLPAGQKVMISK